MYLGSNTTCSPDPCAAFAGACCVNGNGTCHLSFAAGCTDSPNVSFRGVGTTCAPELCVGACCNSATAACSVTNFFGCQFGGIMYLGNNTTCSPNPCGPSPGACCRGTACTVGPGSSCTGGLFQGGSTACGPAGNPTTCCPANFNLVGGLSVQDIFDFLAAYFAGTAAADFNHVGGVTVQDIFDFLAAFFANCS